MKRLLVIAFSVLSGCVMAVPQELTQQMAVLVAEKFIAENGYTDLSQTQVKQNLDLESITWERSREELLKSRFNSLKPKAIGVRNGRRDSPKGWSVAFDYSTPSDSTPPVCRVVTMNADGSEARIEHVDGKREFFAGFGAR